MLNESKILYFLSLAETLSFTQTAAHFGVSQQAVSKGIAALEQDLGVSLFTRSRSSVRLTDAGREWRDFFRPLQDRYRETRERIVQRYASPQASLRLGCQNYMAFSDLTGPPLAQLARTHPDVDIQLENYSPLGLLEHLTSRRLDAVLVCRRFVQRPQGFRILPLFQIPLVVLVSAAHPKLRRDSSYSDFICEPFVTDRMEGESPDACARRARQDCLRYGLTPSKIVTAPNRDSAYAAVEMGQGFLLATASSRSRSRRQLKSFPTNAVDTLVCIWREGGPDPLVDALVGALAAHCHVEVAEETTP